MGRREGSSRYDYTRVWMSRILTSPSQSISLSCSFHLPPSPSLPLQYSSFLFFLPFPPPPSPPSPPPPPPPIHQITAYALLYVYLKSHSPFPTVCSLYIHATIITYTHVYSHIPSIHSYTRYHLYITYFSHIHHYILYTYNPLYILNISYTTLYTIHSALHFSLFSYIPIP